MKLMQTEKSALRDRNREIKNERRFIKTNVFLTDRDVKIIKEIQRWRFLLGRQIKVLGGFGGQRACDRRLAKLIEAGFIERRHFIYGLPRLYFVTQKAVNVLNLEYYTKNLRIEQIQHDIYVIDTAIYLIHNEGVNATSIITERDLRHNAGFGSPKHFPDFTYTKDEKIYCVEIELSTKKQTRLERNIMNNYKKYDTQKWFIPSDKPKTVESVTNAGKKYGIEILPLERVTEYVRKL